MRVQATLRPLQTRSSGRLGVTPSGHGSRGQVTPASPSSPAAPFLAHPPGQMQGPVPRGPRGQVGPQVPGLRPHRAPPSSRGTRQPGALRPASCHPCPDGEELGWGQSLLLSTAHLPTATDRTPGPGLGAADPPGFLSLPGRPQHGHLGQDGPSLTWGSAGAPEAKLRAAASPSAYMGPACPPSGKATWKTCFLAAHGH